MISRENSIEKYCNIYKMNPVIVGNNPMSLVKCMKDREETIALSDNNLIGRMCRFLGIKKKSIKEIETEAEIYFAMIDALNVLSVKHIPVLFYNRVGTKEISNYSSKAKYRINNKIDFIKMTENIEKYKDTLAEIIGDNYSYEYVDKLKVIPQVIHKGNLFCHEDIRTELVNVINGERITVPRNDNAVRNIHVYGRCGAFGYAVSDSENFPSRLQQLLLENKKDEFRVINHGIWGGEDSYILNNFFYELSSFKEGDIVLFYMRHFEEPILENFRHINMYYKDITEEWHDMIGNTECFYDKPGHMNNNGYKFVAEIIYKDLKSINFAEDIQFNDIKDLDARYLNEYLKAHSNSDIAHEVERYIEELRENYPELNHKMSKTGAIVMNCNPFTKGHRYLIETAAGLVDRLIIFVVEEDRSMFKFEDRYDMVKLGTGDLKNVIVVPSGKFIISTITFPEYFLKEYVKEKNFDLTKDLSTFCEYIAPSLGIEIRFAGEEPFDPVTENYNNNMKRILPENGIKFVEIPRKKVDGTERIISATSVRKLMADNKVDELKEYIPETTLNIVIKKYMKGD
ncbi:MAG: adenylyltransferase/cytidyltransferase family protein [Lachnospiraceae bacterium]